MSTATGRRAEAAAADYLRRHGFCVLECNWRTRWCEIDIVASKGDVVYFVEVKYRRRDDWGSGLEYVTHRKLRQMYFAAHFWAAQTIVWSRLNSRVIHRASSVVSLLDSFANFLSVFLRFLVSVPKL
jgi:uncharacterized protein (TIGR00252 family)